MQSVINFLALIVAGIVFLSAPLVQAGPILTNLTLWLDATNIDGSNDSTLSNGNSISQWNDLSGSGLNVTQSISGSQPTFETNVLGGLPVVRFDGNDLLANTTSANSAYPTSADTVFVVLNPTKPSAHEYGIVDSFGSTTRHDVYLNSSGVNIFSNNGGGNIANGNYMSGHYLVYTAVSNGAGSATYINGANQVTGTQSAGTAGAGTLRVGDEQELNTFYTGDIAEILIYKGALSSDDISSNMTYLEEKWDIPEPASLSLVVVGGAALFRRRRA